MTEITVATEHPESPDARWCLGEYYRELDARFEGGFDLTTYGGAGIADMTPPAGLLALARRNGVAVGCGALIWREGFGEVKRMWVAPTARGRGVSRRLLHYLEDTARAAGKPMIRLDTNRVLKEAQLLYLKAGYSEIARFGDNPYAHHWFEKKL